MRKSLRRQGYQFRNFIRISVKEEFFLIGKSILAMLLIDYCFYQSFVALLPLSFPGFCFYQMEKKDLIHRKKEEVRQQFKEMLLLVVTGQKAGYSVENAFLKSYEDMENLYGKDSGICRMLLEIRAGLSNNRKASGIWEKIGEACDIEEIKEFASVFDLARESSGNIDAVMEKTSRTIENRAETKKEIETVLSARKLEQRIMNIMPFLLILYVSITSPGYFDRFYHTLQGMIIMTVCLIIYLCAYIMGAKIASIEA